MASNNYIYKMSNAGGMSTVTRYVDMLAGNTTWNPWEPAGAYDALATVTVPSGGAASIEFAGIPAGYKHLQIRIIARGNNSNTYDSFGLRFNGDTASNYTFHTLYGEGAGTPTATGVNPYSAIRGTEIAGNTASASIFGAAVVDILDYASTSKYKTNRVLGGDDRNGSGIIGMTSGAWMNTSAISSIVIAPIFGSSFLQHSQFALYGVK